MNEVVYEFDAFITSVTANTALQSDVPQIEALGVPASAIAAAETNAVVLLENLVADYTNTALIAAVPTALGNSLRTLLAKPLKAVTDVEAYLQELLADPGSAPVLAELEKEVPKSVQLELEQSPVPFLMSLVEATTVPAFFSAVPTAVQDELASILDKGLSIVLSDLKAVGSVTTHAEGPVRTHGPTATGVSLYECPPSYRASSGVFSSGIFPSRERNATPTTAITGRFVHGARPTQHHQSQHHEVPSDKAKQTE